MIKRCKEAGCHNPVYVGSSGRAYTRCCDCQRAWWAAQRRKRTGCNPRKPASTECAVDGCHAPKRPGYHRCDDHQRQYTRDYARQRREQERLARQRQRERLVLIEDGRTRTVEVVEVLDDVRRDVRRETVEALRVAGLTVCRVE